MRSHLTCWGRCDSLNCLDALAVFQLQGAGVIPCYNRGDGQRQGGADAARTTA